MIELVNVNKIIKNVSILEDINLKIEEGKIYGLIGANGSGKTMLLRIICDLIKPSFGKVLMRKNTSFGVMIENPGFMYEYSGKFNLEYLASINNKISEERINECLKIVGLDASKDKKVKQYSLGMQQKLGIAQAIMEYPDVLLLDEPFNALDIESHKHILKLLYDINKEYGTTIIIATHDENYSKIFENIIFMSNGRIERTV